MSLEVLRLMETRKIQDYSCFSNKALIFGSEQNNQNDRDLDHRLEIKFNSKKEESLQVKCNDKFDNKKQAQPFKFCADLQPLSKRNSILCAKRAYSEVALSVFKNGAYFGTNIVFNVLIRVINFIINLCHNESIRDILTVILAVSVEVFVMLVFSVSTVLATIIVKIDEALRKHRHETRNISKRLLQDRDEVSSNISTIAKAKSRRSRKKSSKNSMEHILVDNSTDIKIYSKQSTISKTPFFSDKGSLASVNDLDLEIPECDIGKSVDKGNNETETHGDLTSNENNKTDSSHCCENHKELEGKDGLEKERKEKSLCVGKGNAENKDSDFNSSIFSIGISGLNESTEIKF